MFHGSSPSSFSAEVGFLGRAAREDARPGRRRSVSSVRSRSSSRLSATAEERSPGDSSDEEPARLSLPSSHAPTVRALSPPAPVRIVESTPLLPGKEEEEHLSSAARGELDILLGYTLPIAGTHFLELSLLVTTVFSVGHLGKTELAAAALSSITVNVIALSVIQGFCTALDTLCSQAASCRPKETSLHALRTALLLAILLLPMTVLLWNAESLLLLLHQDPAVAKLAGLYLKVLSGGLPGYAGFECVRRWLQAQGKMFAPTLALFVAAPLNVVLNYLLVWGPDSVRIGFAGAPLASAISMNTMCAVSIVYSYFFVGREAWGGLSWDITKDLGVNIRLGLAGWALVGSEWLSWELVAMASSFLGPTTLAAQSILLTSASVFYQVPYSLSVAAAVRVGNLLGSQQPDLARTTSRVTLGIAVAVAAGNSLLLVFCRNVWGKLFSSDEEVIAIVANIIPLVAFFQLTDGISGATGGLLRGAGKAPLGAAINLVAYYAFGLPVGLFATFGPAQWGLYGLWFGLSIALLITSVSTTYVIWTLDWGRASDQARRRMGMDDLQVRDCDE